MPGEPARLLCGDAVAARMLGKRAESDLEE